MSATMAALSEENAALIARNMALARQNEALRASTSARRSRLYWAGMQAGGSADGGTGSHLSGPERTHYAMHQIELDAPQSWHDAPIPPESRPSTLYSPPSSPTMQTSLRYLEASSTLSRS